MTDDEVEDEIKKLKKRLTDEIDSRTRDQAAFNKALATVNADNLKLTGICNQLAGEIVALKERLQEMEDDFYAEDDDDTD